MPMNHVDPAISNPIVANALDEFCRIYPDNCVDLESFSKFHASPTANTKISYIYRDAGNCKQYTDVVLTGVISPQELSVLYGHLDEDHCFVPGQVGLPDLQNSFTGGFDQDLDHPFHDLTGIELTTDAPTDPTRSASDLAHSFNGISWDEHHRP